ncbi:MAG TPA: aspartate/glutamate racemase family protein [Phototrophicaceae bacterium]|nr:aspartate/glutamate racemase family protein [Phototrophicaceae bacterium]
MKTIGMIGGMSWESSIEYYRMVNETVKLRLGGLHSAQCLMYSVDFAQIEQYQHESRWQEAGQVMADAARRLERGGADFIVLCTNTMHKLADYIEQAVEIPLLHIADPTAQAIQAAGITKVGLLGTAFTMEQDFYRGRLTDKYGLDVLIPDADERAIIHRVIYDELVLGIVKDESREAYKHIIDHLVERGAQGIILGCTEIMLLISPNDCPVPSFDTTTLHAVAAVDYALESLAT